MDILLKIWNEHVAITTALLAAFNLFLIFYCIKGLNKLHSQKQHSRRATKKIIALRKLSSNDENLFKVKKLINDKDPAIALRAANILLKKKHPINYEQLRSLTAIAFKHRTQLAACLSRISKSGQYPMLFDLVKDNEAPWVCVIALNALAKAQVPDLLPMLLNAQDHASQEVKDCANKILSRNEQFQKFAT